MSAYRRSSLPATALMACLTLTGCEGLFDTLSFTYVDIAVNNAQLGWCGILDTGEAQCHQDFDFSVQIQGNNVLARESIYQDPILLDTLSSTTSYVQADAYDGNVCLLDSDGVASCWTHPNIVINDTVDPQVAGRWDGDFVLISVGRMNACGIDTEGAIACWGKDSSTHFSQGLPAGSFIDIDVGNQTQCALRDNGEAVCWGKGTEPGHTWDDPPSEGRYSLIAVEDGDWACGVRSSDQGVDCWGSRHTGELNASAELEQRQARFLHLHNTRYCGLSPDGTAFYGGDDQGQRGPSNNDFVKLGCARYNEARVALALTDAGEVVSWSTDTGLQVDPYDWADIGVLLGN